jgi:hypothetical protein
MVELVAPAGALALAAAGAKGKAVKQSPPTEMAARTLRIYSEVKPSAHDSPSSDATAADAGGLASTMRRLAAMPTIRRMSRLTPARVRKALKARLR